MANLTFKTAGESHGPALIAFIEGLPAGVPIDLDLINSELRRRQGGYGRGGRQKIETDSATILSGVRQGKSIGSPIVLQILNRDSRLDQAPPIHRPRPGHADLPGCVKYLTNDCRPILERASARETAARVAAGALSKCLLNAFNIQSFAYVLSIGPVKAQIDFSKPLSELKLLRDQGDLFTDWVACPDPTASEQMRQAIRAAKEASDTLGGVVEARISGCPMGLGSMTQFDQRLDARLAMAVMGIQAFKAVEIGLGIKAADLPGSQVHDEIFYAPPLQNEPTSTSPPASSLQPPASLGYTRKSNNAGGLEGGITNGQPLIIRGAMKPIATLGPKIALNSVDLLTKEASKAAYERSDVCAVPAASVILENVCAFEVARALVDKFAGDSLTEMLSNYNNFLELAKKL